MHSLGGIIHTLFTFFIFIYSFIDSCFVLRTAAIKLFKLFFINITECLSIYNLIKYFVATGNTTFTSIEVTCEFVSLPTFSFQISQILHIFITMSLIVRSSQTEIWQSRNIENIISNLHLIHTKIHVLYLWQFMHMLHVYRFWGLHYSEV